LAFKKFQVLAFILIDFVGGLLLTLEAKMNYADYFEIA
jgi:hypothetical protein